LFHYCIPVPFDEILFYPSVHPPKMCDTIPAPLAGKTAIVTGGSRGIGAGIALDLARKGCVAIAITYANQKAAADAVLKSIEDTSPAIRTAAIQMDLLSPDFGTSVIKQALCHLQISNIDIVISNAAFADVRYNQRMHEHSKAIFDQMMTANAWSPMSLAIAALPYIPRGGRIVNISSIASKRANTDPVVIYGASKAALDTITRGLAATYSRAHGITVNGIAVGPTKTDALNAALDAMSQEAMDKMKADITAADRIGEVEDVVGVVTFLCSEEAGWINGNYIPVNGGALLALQG
jgi:3-oxoacyl-[acyl-carrier protein] reductase